MKAPTTDNSREPAAVNVARVLLLSTAVVPLIILANSFFPFIVPRTLYFRVVVEVALGILAYLLISREWRPQIRLDPFLFAFGAFVLANCVSALFSPARNRAMFGDFERMGGVWALLHYLLFYALTRVFFGARQWKIYLNLLIGVSTVVALIALRQGAGTRGADATVGNPGLLGLYLFFGVCISVFVATHSSKRLIGVYVATALINLFGMVVSQNRSSVLALFVASGLCTITYLFRGRKHRIWIAGLAVSLLLVFAAAMAVVIRAPDSAAAKRLPTTLARIRDAGIAGRAVFWRAGYEGFKQRPLVGYGPENFHLAWSSNFQTDVYTVTREERVDRAHNIIVEVLSTTGLLGITTFLAMWFAVFASVVNGLRTRELRLPDGIFFAAASAGYLVALIFWFIDINSFIPWLAICAFLAHERVKGPMIEFGRSQVIDPIRKIIFAGSVVALLSSLWLHGFETFRVARLLYDTQAAGGDMPTTLHKYFKVFDSPVPQTTHTPMLFGRYMGSVIPGLREANLDRSTRLLVDTAFARGLIAMEHERKKDHRNELIYLQQSRLALLASSFYGLPAYYEYAVKTLRDAVALSPRRVQPKLALAYTLMMGRRFAEAHTQLLQAKAIWPSGQVYHYLGEFYRLQDSLPQAIAALDSSLLLGYRGPPSVYYSLVDTLQGRGAYAESARLTESYLTVALPDFRSTTPRARPIENASAVVPFVARLPWLWAMAGDYKRATAAAQSFKAIYPANVGITDEFIRSLNSGGTGWQQDSTLLRRTAAPPGTSG